MQHFKKPIANGSLLIATKPKAAFFALGRLGVLFSKNRLHT
jgi:hypothetical protein